MRLSKQCLRPGFLLFLPNIINQHSSLRTHMRLLNRLAVLTVLPLASCAIGPSSSSDTGFGASPAILPWSTSRPFRRALQATCPPLPPASLSLRLLAASRTRAGYTRCPTAMYSLRKAMRHRTGGRFRVLSRLDSSEQAKRPLLHKAGIRRVYAGAPGFGYACA